jgi:uncharacterized protein (TIGR00299 family) protein
MLMTIAYFDTIAGISGDMTLGAFVSAGMPIDALRSEIAKLALEGVEIEAAHTLRNGITAVAVDVVVTSPQTHHRHLKDIVAIIDKSALSARVKDDAKRIFMELALAEAAVHNSTIEKIHFHEVGALDAIVDIVGAAICLEHFQVGEVYSSPVKLGSGGFVETEHGRLPLPGPAVSEILKGYPTVLTDLPFELTTPTGAAIIKAMSRGVLANEPMRVHAIGYGAGKREMPQVPNLLRVMIGELSSAGEELTVLEANIDDMNPEIYPFLIERLLAAGANDAHLVPVIMKKGRPGVLLSVLAEPSRARELAGMVLAETTTLGVRMHAVVRRTLARSQREVMTGYGPVRVKVVAAAGGGRERCIPEYEECKRIALERAIPLIEVYRHLEGELNG